MLKNMKIKEIPMKIAGFRMIKKISAVLCVWSIFSAAVFAADAKSTGKAQETQKTTSAAKSQNPKVKFVQELQSLLNSGKIDEAISSFDSLDEKLKDDEGLLMIKASLLISAARTAEASEVLSRLEQKNPSNIDVLEMKIIAAKAGGDKTKAQKNAAISKVLALDPNNTTANIELAQENVLQRKYKTARTYY